VYYLKSLHRLRGAKRQRLLKFIFICLAIFLFLELLILAENRLRPAILSVAELRADFLATDAVNQAVLEQVSRGTLYKELIQIEQDESGRIVMAKLNTGKINKIMSETTIATQEALLDISSEPFLIPMGEIFDHYLLATYGPNIPVQFIPVGRVNTGLIDSFESAGINQVRHKIYLDIITEVRIVIPFLGKELEVHTTVPLADTIYPGEVPETVINLGTGAISLEREFP